jgi:hypothetical protein
VQKLIFPNKSQSERDDFACLLETQPVDSPEVQVLCEERGDASVRWEVLDGYDGGFRR